MRQIALESQGRFEWYGKETQREMFSAIYTDFKLMNHYVLRKRLPLRGAVSAKGCHLLRGFLVLLPRQFHIQSCGE